MIPHQKTIQEIKIRFMSQQKLSLQGETVKICSYVVPRNMWSMLPIDGKYVLLNQVV